MNCTRSAISLVFCFVVFGAPPKLIGDDNTAASVKALRETPATFVHADSDTGEISISSGNALTDEILSKARNVPNIVTLSLLESPVSDQAVIGILTASPKLSTPILQGTKVTDVTMRELRRVPALRYLNISHTDVSDKAIPQIVALPGLEELVLRNTRITENGVKQLLASRPRLVVDFTPRKPDGNKENRKWQK